MAFPLRNLFIFLFLLLISSIPFFAYAQSAEEVRNKINTQQGEITKIEQDIKKYEVQLTNIGKKKQTLQGAVYELDVSRNKVSSSISLAQKQINYTNETIGNLIADIKEKETSISKNQKANERTRRLLICRKNSE